MTSSIGDSTYLSNYLVNTKVYGVVVPPGNPPEFWATYEIAGDEGTLFMAAVLGPDGVPGRDAFGLKLQTDSTDTPDQLPRTISCCMHAAAAFSGRLPPCLGGCSLAEGFLTR